MPSICGLSLQGEKTGMKETVAEPQGLRRGGPTNSGQTWAALHQGKAREQE